jgi:hypothetical protein
MMPFKEDGHHNILELLYNIKYQKRPIHGGKCFWHFQETIKELMCKLDLNVTFLSNVFSC